MFSLSHQLHRINGEVIAHSRTHAAVGDDAHASARGLAVQRMLLPDDVGVSTQIAKRNTGLDCRTRQCQIVKVRHSAQGDVVVFQNASYRVVIADVQCDRVRDFVVDQLIHAVCSTSRQPSIDIG